MYCFALFWNDGDTECNHSKAWNICLDRLLPDHPASSRSTIPSLSLEKKAGFHIVTMVSCRGSSISASYCNIQRFLWGYLSFCSQTYRRYCQRDAYLREGYVSHISPSLLIDISRNPIFLNSCARCDTYLTPGGRYQRKWAISYLLECI